MIFKALLRFSNFGLLNKISNSTLILQTKLSSVKTLSAIRGSRKLTLKSQILNKIYSSELFSNFEKTGNNKLNPYLRPKNNTDIKYSFAYEEAVASK